MSDISKNSCEIVGLYAFKSGEHNASVHIYHILSFIGDGKYLCRMVSKNYVEGLPSVYCIKTLDFFCSEYCALSEKEDFHKVLAIAEYNRTTGSNFVDFPPAEPCT